MKQPHTRRLLPLICALLLLIACRPPAENELTPGSPTAVAAIEMTILPRSPSPEPMATSTRASPAPTASSMPPTATPLLQVTSTATALPTMVSTLTPEEKWESIQQLFETNGGCQLPCFWGIAPGETDWKTADQILRPLADEITLFGLPDPFTAEVRLGNIDPDERRRFYFSVEDGVVRDFSGRASLLPFYAPASILAKYGPPAEVYLVAGGDYSSGTIPFSVTLFYPQHGFWLLYGTDGVRVDDHYNGCFFEYNNPPPENISPYLPEFSAAPYFAAWEPGEVKFISEGPESARQLMGGFESPPTLVDTTTYDIESFTETFSDPTVPLCLETPAEFWIQYWSGG